ncbi:MAG: rhamnogalacturonan acetylesterase [Acidobacteriota bacterium]|nr:rhamnogalacturonan acetylesterase [Acidobacteriota bacterium]
MPRSAISRLLPAALLAVALSASTQTPAPAAPQPTPAPAPPALSGPLTFTCGAAKKGQTPLTASTRFTDTTAGFDLVAAPTVAGGSCSSSATDQPFFFSIPLPEGNYRVTLALGGRAASTTTVRAEARRLYVEKLPVAADATLTRTLDINVRVPEFTRPDGTLGRVRLKQREIGNLDWDAKLTLEFNGVNPSVRSITVEPLTGARAEPVLYLAGDSTMVDQDVEPWASWGQMLPRFFTPGIVIANHAESGESATSFVGEQRFAKILSLIQPGDWFFVQFAHNDQKIANGLPRYTEIMTGFVAQVRAKGATPVIVTSMNRDDFDEAGHIRDTLGGYPQASRQIAADTHTALIDLNDLSKTLFEAMGPGPNGADHAFMKFAAGSYPGVATAINDSTHFNNYGAYELARSIVHGIREAKLPLAGFLDPTVPDFNPAHPDAFATFHLPYTPMQKHEDTTKIPQANLN